MAYEIEIKAFIGDKHHIMSVLTDKGCIWGETRRQHDEVYHMQNQEIFFRIRSENNKNLLTFKKIIDNLEVVEYESEIGNCEEVKRMILALGFEEYVIINKERTTGKLDEFNICLDEVESLGNFIEAEKIIEDESKRKSTKRELAQFLLSLGINEEQVCNMRYHTMLYAKRGR